MALSEELAHQDCVLQPEFEMHFTSSLVLPSHDDTDAPSLLLSLDDMRPAEYTLPADTEARQDQRRQELRQYLYHVKGIQEADGSKQQQRGFGVEFYKLLERHLHEQKAEYASIRGWVPTPTGEEATVPLASPSDDPRVQEGLRHILQLDRRLMQKSAQLALVARDTFPDKWEAADRKQAQRDEQLLLDSLNRERMRQERINKLANAVEAQDMDESMQDHVGLSLAGNFRRRLLTAEDEKLLDQLLAQNEQDAWSSNPFDLDVSQAADLQDTGSSSLADINAKLAALQDEHAQNTLDMASIRSTSHVSIEYARPSTSNSSVTQLTTTKSYIESHMAEPIDLHEMLVDTSDDYLSAKRHVRVLATALENVDARLRMLQTAELPQAPSPQQMAMLIQTCQRQLDYQQSLPQEDAVAQACLSPIAC